MNDKVLSRWVSYPPIPMQNSYDTGLVIMAYNRPYCVRKLFKHLADSELSNVLIIIIDDASDNPETLQLIQDFSIPDVPVIKCFLIQHRHFNIHENLRMGWDMLIDKYHCRYLAVLDSDVIVKPDWLERIRALHTASKVSYPTTIVSGFDACISHPRYKTYADYKIKRSLGGANMFFDSALYPDVIRPRLVPYWDSIIVEYFQEKSYPFLVTRPSVIQHIGYRGLFGSGYWMHDFSVNYSVGSTVFLLPSYIWNKMRQIILFYIKRLKKRLINNG